MPGLRADAQRWVVHSPGEPPIASFADEVDANEYVEKLQRHSLTGMADDLVVEDQQDDIDHDLRLHTALLMGGDVLKKLLEALTDE